VSRNTKGAASKKPLFYRVNIGITPNYQALPSNRPYKTIVEIFDGELVVD
jgi:hypothetical protein